MEHLQIIVSVVVVLIAACVALICDFLKRNNEQLRELNIELKMRQELDAKEQPRAEAAPNAAAPVRAVEATPVDEKPAEPVAAQQERPKHNAGKEKKRTVNSEALAVMERGAALAGTGKRPRAAEPKPEVKMEVKIEPRPERKVEPLAQAAPAAPAAPAKKDWGSLLSRNAQAPKNAKPAFQTVVAATSGEMALPAGFQDGFVLTKLVQSRQPVSGLVVSIGVNASCKADGKLPESVRNLVGSLIGPGDFAAQSSEDEFLLIYPREQGAAAQRRLSQIAQQLWDFQLRSLGSFQILFSWGGIEVHSESLEEAIASASERMQETKRGRKLLAMPTPTPVSVPSKLRQAV